MALAAFAALISVPMAPSWAWSVRSNGAASLIVSSISWRWRSCRFLEYFLGLLLIPFLPIRFNVLPSLADTHDGMSFLRAAQATALPALTLFSLPWHR